MSSYLCIYLKDTEREDNYVILNDYGGYYRDAFRHELGYNVEYDTTNTPRATLVSTDDIRDIIEYIEKDIQLSLDNINKAKNHIELISQMIDKSINERLEAIQNEENYIAECQEDIKIYQSVKNFYVVLLDLSSDSDRIYAGIDCFAPDGSNIEK